MIWAMMRATGGPRVDHRIHWNAYKYEGKRKKKKKNRSGIVDIFDHRVSSPIESYGKRAQKNSFLWQGESFLLRKTEL